MSEVFPLAVFVLVALLALLALPLLALAGVARSLDSAGTANTSGIEALPVPKNLPHKVSCGESSSGIALKMCWSSCRMSARGTAEPCASI